MSSNIRKIAISGVIWNLISYGGQQIIFFLINVVLARLLVPADFGLLGMIVFFTAIAQSFVDSGFTSALIQKKETTREDYSTVFYFNIFMAMLLFSALCVAAPAISNFYDEPRLTKLIRFISISLIIYAFGMVQKARYTKQIDFKILTITNISSTIISGVIGIILAYNGFGYWSLAIKFMLNSLLTTVLLWFFSNWKPAIMFNFNSFISLFGFGSRLLLSGMLNNISNYIYNVIIGKYYSARDLGYYSQAQQLQQIPVTNITSIVGNVSYPLLSSLQSDHDVFLKGYRKSIKLICFVNFPLMIGMSIMADSLILFVFTSKWAATIPYLRLLCLSGLVYPISAISLNALNAKGRSDIFLKLEVIKQLLMIAVILCTIKYGILILVLGKVAMSFVAYLLNLIYSTKVIKYRLKDHLSDILPTLVSAIVMGAFIYFVGLMSYGTILIKMLTQFTLGVLIYLALAIFFKLEALKEFRVIYAHYRK